MIRRTYVAVLPQLAGVAAEACLVSRNAIEGLRSVEDGFG
jgi:hypothetical protein